MTREEFIKKLNVVKNWTPEEQASFCEDVGLMKFDKPVSKSFTLYEAVKHCRASYASNLEFVEGLNNFGYKIVPIE